MTQELLDAHDAGTVEVAIGRASDYFGPGATHSALGELVFATALQGKTGPGHGRPRPASTPTRTRRTSPPASIALGADARATGEVWHLPVAETWTTRQIIEHVYALAGTKPRLFAGRQAPRCGCTA